MALIAGFCLTLGGCDNGDSRWQEQTLEKIQAVSKAGWDDFSARRLPKLVHTIKNDPDKAGQAWLQLALLLQSHEATTLATEIFRNLDNQAADADPLKPVYRYFLASGLAENGSLDEALKTLNAGFDSLNDLDKIAFLLTQASWLMENGQVEAASKALKAVEKISPHYPELLYRQATLALQNGDCQRAIEKLSIMLEYKPGLTQLYGPLASAYRQCGQRQQAEKALFKKADGKLAFDNRFTRMAEQIGNPVKFLRSQVRQATAAEQLPQAYKLNTQLLKLMPKDPTNWLNQGSILYRMGRYDLASKAYRKGLALQPDHADLLTNLGNALWQQGQVDEAAQQYQQALQAEPRQSQARLNLAGLRLQQGRMKDSESLYLELLAIEPAHAMAQAGLIQSLLAQGKAVPAMQILEQWWRQYPSDQALARLILRTVLQAEISPQQASADWITALFAGKKAVSAFYPGGQSGNGWRNESTQSQGRLLDLIALWRYKTGVQKNKERLLRWWQQERATAGAPTDTSTREDMQTALHQIAAGQTPALVHSSKQQP